LGKGLRSVPSAGSSRYLGLQDTKVAKIQLFMELKRQQCDQRRRRKSGFRGREVVMGQVTWGLIGKELGWHSK